MTPFWRGVLEAAAALGFIALVFTWLLKRLVVRIAGESEPLYFHSYWGSALPLRGPLRIALVAVAVGVCAGVVVRSIFDTAVFNGISYPSGEPRKLADQRANGTGEIV